MLGARLGLGRGALVADESAAGVRGSAEAARRSTGAAGDVFAIAGGVAAGGAGRGCCGSTAGAAAAAAAAFAFVAALVAAAFFAAADRAAAVLAAAAGRAAFVPAAAGLAAPGLAAPGLAGADLGAPGLAVPGLAVPALAVPGLAAPDRAGDDAEGASVPVAGCSESASAAPNAVVGVTRAGVPVVPGTAVEVASPGAAADFPGGLARGGVPRAAGGLRTGDLRTVAGLVAGTTAEGSGKAGAASARKGEESAAARPGLRAPDDCPAGSELGGTVVTRLTYQGQSD